MSSFGDISHVYLIELASGLPCDAVAVIVGHLLSPLIYIAERGYDVAEDIFAESRNRRQYIALYAPGQVLIAHVTYFGLPGHFFACAARFAAHPAFGPADPRSFALGAVVKFTLMLFNDIRHFTDDRESLVVVRGRKV